MLLSFRMISRVFPIFSPLFSISVSYCYTFWEISSTLSSSHLIELFICNIIFQSWALFFFFSACLSYTLYNFTDAMSSLKSQRWEIIWLYLHTIQSSAKLIREELPPINTFFSHILLFFFYICFFSHGIFLRQYSLWTTRLFLIGFTISFCLFLLEYWKLRIYPVTEYFLMGYSFQR